MTIQEAITQTDELCRNAYSTKQKLVWLSRAEAMIKKDVIDTHEDGEEVSFTGIDENTLPETELIMPQPYDEGYIHWLQAQICYANEETDRYNRAITMFNSTLDGFKTWYKTQHIPLGLGRFRF